MALPVVYLKFSIIQILLPLLTFSSTRTHEKSSGFQLFSVGLLMKSSALKSVVLLSRRELLFSISKGMKIWLSMSPTSCDDFLLSLHYCLVINLGSIKSPLLRHEFKV